MGTAVSQFQHRTKNQSQFQHWAGANLGANIYICWAPFWHRPRSGTGWPNYALCWFHHLQLYHWTALWPKMNTVLIWGRPSSGTGTVQSPSASSWGKSAFRDYLWDNKLDSWDFIFTGNVQNSELGIEITITSIFWYFSEQSNHNVNVIIPAWLNYQGRFGCLCAYIIYNLILYAHHYAEKTNHERNEKSWELSERSKPINKPFFVNGRFLVKWPCFKIRPFS